MLEEALAYASRGWAVFPLRPKDKRPATEHGLDDATTDPAKIRRWWQETPAANIGVVTGESAGFWVIDLDLKGQTSGADSLAHLEEEYGYLPDTVEQVTPSGGRHLLFRWSGTPVGNSASKIAPGIDTRGNRGYIVAPPSVHPNGKPYQWAEGRDPEHSELAEAPDWLLKLTQSRPSTAQSAAYTPSTHETGTAYVDKAVANEADLVRAAGPGTRNSQLNQSGFNLGGFVGSGLLTKHHAESALYNAAVANGLVDEDGEHSVRNTIKSGLSAGAAKAPRDVPDRRNGHDRSARRSQTSHSAFIDNGRPRDLQPLDWLSPAMWQGQPVPERRWFVADLIPEGNVTMLAGDGGIGKSLLALQLLAASALGKPWIGRGARPCKAMGLFCEDDETELRIRLDPILHHHGTEMSELSNLKIISRVGEDSLLVEHQDQWRAGEPSPLWTRIQNDVLDFGAQIVVLDSLHDFFGGNENSRPQARQFIGLLRGLAMRINGAVVLTSHPSMSGRSLGTGEAGSTAWNNAVRSRLYLTSPKAGVDEDAGAEPDKRVLSTKKANYTRRAGEIKLEWRDGVFVSDEPDQGFLGSIDRQSCENLFLHLIGRLAKENRFVSDNARAGNYAPRILLGLPESQGRTIGEFRRAMETLFAEGKIEIQNYQGSNRHSHRCIAVKEVKT